MCQLTITHISVTITSQNRTMRDFGSDVVYWRGRDMITRNWIF